MEDESNGSFPVGKFLKDSVVILIASSVLAFAWQAIPQAELPGTAFQLRANFIGWIFSSILIFILLEVPAAIIRFSAVNAPVRPSIGKIIFACFSIPILGSIVFNSFCRFDVIYIEDNTVTLRGPSFLASNTFNVDKIDRVYITKYPWYVAIDFRWRDRVDQSVWVWEIDKESTAHLDRFVKRMAQDGIVVPTLKPRQSWRDVPRQR